MHASVVTNYQQQPIQQAQQLHHHHSQHNQIQQQQQQQQQTQQHYYEQYQTETPLNVGLHDGACLQRSVGVENVVAVVVDQENNQDGERSNGPPNTSNEPQISSLAASNQEEEEEEEEEAGLDLIEQQQRSQQEHIQTGTDEVHFLNSHNTTTTGGGAVIYGTLGQEHSTLQHYRYSRAPTTTTAAASAPMCVSYQMHTDEQQYYEHNNQPPDQTLAGFVLNHDHEHQSTSFRHEHQLQQQQTEHMAHSSNRQQAVDLTNSDQQQQHQSQSQGTFESAPAIYYDLTSVGVPDHNAPTTTITTATTTNTPTIISTTLLDYHEHQNPHGPLTQHHIEHQQRLPSSSSVVYQQPQFQSYQPGPAAELVRQPSEFVSVLTEQNRFLRPAECSDGLNTASSVSLLSSCHQNQLAQSYQAYHNAQSPSSLSRLTDNTLQLDQSSSTTAYTNNPFNSNKIHQHAESQLPLAPESNELGSQQYSQSLNQIVTNYHHQHQHQGICLPAEHHQANNENYHHIHQHNHEQQLVEHQNQHQHQQHHFHHHHHHHHLEHHDQSESDNRTRIDKPQQVVDYDDATHLIIMGNSSSSSAHPRARDTHSCAPSTLSDTSSMTTNSDLESVDSALTRDEKKAREANIPLSYHEIVNLSIDQFNDHISRSSYSEAQLTLMKDIRRRGKNKVAAQTCRKRKMEQITELQHEVGELVNKRMMLVLERSRLSQEHAKLVKDYNRWCSLIQSHLQTEQQQQVIVHGQPANVGDTNCVGVDDGDGNRCGELVAPNNGDLIQDKLDWSTPTVAKSVAANEDEGVTQQQVPLC